MKTIWTEQTDDISGFQLFIAECISETNGNRSGGEIQLSQGQTEQFATYFLLWEVCERHK